MPLSKKRMAELSRKRRHETKQNDKPTTNLNYDSKTFGFATKDVPKSSWMENSHIINEKAKRPIHPNSLANLRPVKPGQILNPKGSPKRVDCLLSCIKEELGKPSMAVGLTNEQLIASMLVAQATKGNIKAVELMMAYLHAKPNQGVDLNAKGELLVRWDGNRGTDASK